MQVMRVLQQQQMLEAAGGIDSLSELMHSTPGLVCPKPIRNLGAPFVKL